MGTPGEPLPAARRPRTGHAPRPARTTSTGRPPRSPWRTCRPHRRTGPPSTPTTRPADTLPAP
eukprot:297969-Prymnesium_polylepis.1